MTWEPEWEEYDDGNAHFSDIGKWGSNTKIILRRTKTENGNWLYMAISSGDSAAEGGVALAIEHVNKNE